MRYESQLMEENAIMQTAAAMCAAARTAPKTKGRDFIVTCVVTGEEKEALANKMEEIHHREFGEKEFAWYLRDAANIHAADAVVLIGIKHNYRGVAHCGFCGFENCGACKKAGGRCAFAYMDLGIALASAAEIACRVHIDNRIMYSVGNAAMQLGYVDTNILWHGIPISASGKSIFFDR